MQSSWNWHLRVVASLVSCLWLVYLKRFRSKVSGGSMVKVYMWLDLNDGYFSVVFTIQNLLIRCYTWEHLFWVVWFNWLFLIKNWEDALGEEVDSHNMFVLFHVDVGGIDVESVVLVEEVVGETGGFEEDFDLE